MRRRETSEQPVRTVYVDAFYMDETEVTNTQFKEFLLENPQWQKGRVNAKFADADYLDLWNGNNYPIGKGNHPVVGELVCGDGLRRMGRQAATDRSGMGIRSTGRLGG